MPSKSYSKEQKEALRVKLLETALDLYSKNGVRNVRLVDILQVVGISKPFFYTFFDSVQEFVLCVIDFQWIRLTEIADEIEMQTALPWQQRARMLFDTVVHYREHGLLVMTQAEEVWVRARLDEARFRAFMERQLGFFALLLRRWDVPQGACTPAAFGNLILSMIITYNSAQQAFPFFYLNALEDTAAAQAEAIIAYLEKLQK